VAVWMKYIAGKRDTKFGYFVRDEVNCLQYNYVGAYLTRRRVKAATH